MAYWLHPRVPSHCATCALSQRLKLLVSFAWYHAPGLIATYFTGSGSGSGNGSESSPKSAKSEKSESVGLEKVALNRGAISASSLFMVCGPAGFIVTAAIFLFQMYD